MIEKKLKCVCIYPYHKLECGEDYIVYKCKDGIYRVNGLAFDEFEFKGIFDIKEEL